MLALLLLILSPVLALFVAIKAPEGVGVPVGMWLTRAEGRAAWRRLSAAVAAGRPPGREVIDGALVLAGGILLIVPGFITDVLGLVLLAPTRQLAREALARNFQSRLVVAATRFSGAPRTEYDVDSTATDLDRPQLQG